MPEADRRPPTTAPTTPRPTSRRGSPRRPSARCSTLRDGLPPSSRPSRALREVCDALAGGHRPGRHRRRARLRLPLLHPRLPGPAAPRGRRHPPGRPDRASSRSAPLQEALDGTEWILHAATQDLPCLTELGLQPTRLFDTELAGRLLGYPRVGLATLVETLLGYRLAKEHSAVDWSTRPLPEPWLEYAALDVEVLVELRDALAAELEAAGKAEWARQEFDHLRSFEPVPRVDAWRRTSGLHRVRGRRGAGRRPRAVGDPRRDRRAARRDPGPDPARLRDRRGRARDARRPGRAAGHQGLPRPRRRALRPPLGRGAARGRRDMPEDDLPTRAPARRRPAAAARLGREGPGRRPPARPWPARRSPGSPRSTTCRPRTCSPPTTCAGPCGRRRRAATRRPLTEAVAHPARGVRRPAVADRPHRAVLVAAILEADREPAPAEPEPRRPDDVDARPTDRLTGLLRSADSLGLGDSRPPGRARSGSPRRSAG